MKKITTKKFLGKAVADPRLRSLEERRVLQPYIFVQFSRKNHELLPPATNLRQGNGVYTCLDPSFCSWGQGGLPNPLPGFGRPPLWMQTPLSPWMHIPLGWADPPVGQTHPHADTPLDADPLDWADPPQYSQQAGGTHPTGMHTCKRIIWSMGMSPLDPSLRSEQCRIEDFPEGVANSQSGCANLLFCNFFAKNYMKMKEFGPPGGSRPLGSANGEDNE